MDLYKRTVCKEYKNNPITFKQINLLAWKLAEKEGDKKLYNKIKSFGNANEMAQVLSQMMEFSENLEGIKSVLEKGLNND